MLPFSGWKLDNIPSRTLIYFVRWPRDVIFSFGVGGDIAT